MSDSYLSDVKNYLLNLQNNICQALEQKDGKAVFVEDSWQHSQGGGGQTRVMTQGAVFEKAGVNFSHVQGDFLPAAATATRPELKDRQFDATGVSLVLHPSNPWVPTVHANWRFFIARKPGEAPLWWFGGGMDLTPYYGDDADCIHWHRVIKQACDEVDETYYPTFKAWCDDYFYLPHREEHRGIGGIFFDDFNKNDFEHSFSFLKATSQSFLEAYLPIVAKQKQKAYTDAHRAFQQYRRGRYVEFNLVYDRGTLFGLQTKGRTESILMSLPPVVNWHYNWQPNPGSQEEKLTQYYLKPRDWLATNNTSPLAGEDARRADEGVKISDGHE